MNDHVPHHVLTGIALRDRMPMLQWLPRPGLGAGPLIAFQHPAFPAAANQPLTYSARQALADQ